MSELEDLTKHYSALDSSTNPYSIPNIADLIILALAIPFVYFVPSYPTISMIIIFSLISIFFGKFFYFFHQHDKYERISYENARRRAMKELKGEKQKNDTE